jgi:mono/diheme cytochrome c family protein/DNA-binding beta-propeller fold protein YncE
MRMPRADVALAALLLAAAPGAACAEGAIDAHTAKQLYLQHCAVCHGSDRLGGQGPALLPENLGRLRKAQAARVIAKGRTDTQMAGFGKVLSKAEIDGLVALIYTRPPKVPRWGLAEIKASHVIKADPDKLPDKTKFTADPLNLFVVVETGDHHVTILDGDKFVPIYRFPSRFALHGGPKFSPTGRFVYFASRDGWISMFDIYNLTLVAEIRAGINTRNIAISDDGRYVAVANYLPHSLVVLDARDLSPLKVIPATDRSGKKSSRVSAVYQAAPRSSFVVALKDLPELWEVSYADKPPERFAGFVHSHEKGMTEALAPEGRFPILRIDLKEPLDDFFFDQTYRHVLGSARDGKSAVVVGLDVRQPIARVDLPGLPHLGSGITWTYHGRRVMATPHLGEGAISVIDMKTWRVIKRIKTLGPGFFLRSHKNSRYAWADVFFGPNRDAIHVIDKQTLKIVKTLRPAPGKTAAHVEFTRDGRYALVSIWAMDGAIVVYDAKTLKEVKRIPFRKPSGKYNVYNKITREEGTSH